MNHNFYLDAVEKSILSNKSNYGCLRRNFGAIIVNNGTLVSSGGPNRSPDGTESCIELGYCTRIKNNIPRGTRYELCRSVHAEQQAIINAGKSLTEGSTLYLVGKEYSDDSYVKDAEPCIMCKRLIINAGISTVVVRISKTNYRVIDVKSWIEDDKSIICEDTYSN
jgi:dCMP deaminase